MLTQNDKETLMSFVEEMEDIFGDPEQALAMASLMAETHLESSSSEEQRKKNWAARQFYLAQLRKHQQMRYS